MLQLRVHSLTHETDRICRIDLRPDPASAALPPFTAGAHIDLHLADKLVRSYSLCNAQDEHHRYVICVQREDNGRGGSAFIFRSVKEGDVLAVDPPRNNFKVEESATHSLFVAGGIGITPILSMIARLSALHRNWTLYYCARAEQDAALLPELRALDGQSGTAHFHFDDKAGGFLDLKPVISSAPPSTHFYCCGPVPLMAAFREATAGLPAEQVHVEYFTPPQSVDLDGSFEVELAQSHVTVTVEAGQSIVAALLKAGIDVPFACEEGLCGACITPVLSGEPDHRDFVLSDADRASNKLITLCCSRSKSPRLVLDI